MTKRIFLGVTIWREIIVAVSITAGVLVYLFAAVDAVNHGGWNWRIFVPPTVVIVIAAWRGRRTRKAKAKAAMLRLGQIERGLDRATILARQAAERALAERKESDHA
jgi:hypothetical protein